MVIDSLGHGGAEKQFCEVVDRLDRNLFSVFVCLTTGDPSGLKRLDQEKLSGSYVLGAGAGPGPWLMLCRAWKLSRVIHRVRPDVVHAWLWYSCVVSAAARCLVQTKAKLILALHCSLDWFESQGIGGKLRAWMAVAANHLCDLVLTLSPSMKRTLIQRWGHHKVLLEIVPNGIDLSEADCVRSDPTVRCVVRKELGWREDTLGLCFIGSLVKGKGHSFLIEALKNLKERLPKVRLVLVGGGVLQDTLRQQAQQADLSDRIVFSGYQPKPLAYLAASDAFVLPSLSEGMPMVILEAMSMGLPVVATRVGAVSDLIEDGFSGLLVPPGDSESIATAVERLRQADFREALGRQARRTAESMTIEKTTSLLSSWYRRLATMCGRE